MNKKTIVLGAIALSLAIAIPVFAQTVTAKGGVSATAAPSVTATNPTTLIACVGTAVNAREASIDAGVTTYTGAANAAYTARATALQQAYTLTTIPAVKAAVKTAWSTFDSSMKSARSTWATTKANAWTQFGTATNACKGSATVTDTANVVAGI